MTAAAGTETRLPLDGDAGRILKACRVIEAGRLKVLDADHRAGYVVAHVLSSDGGTVYRTARREGRWSCSCQARQFGNRCVHADAVALVT